MKEGRHAVRSRGFDDGGLDAFLDKLVTENEAARTTARKG